MLRSATQHETTSTKSKQLKPHKQTFYTTLSEETGVRCQSYLTDKDLVVVLVCILAQSICHVGDPIFQMVHSIFTANAGGKTENQMFQTNMTDVRIDDFVKN